MQLYGDQRARKTREKESVVSEARRRQKDRPLIDVDRQNSQRTRRCSSDHARCSHARAPRWAQKQLISATIFARPGRAAVSSKPDARDTVKWLTMLVYGLIDRPRATLQRCCSAGACEVSPFFTSLLWLRHSLFSAQVRCCRRPGE